ncbi:MAG: hypothetical protein HOB79_01295 [Rhodospirillaceae bacterium]|jgi:uncharacterized membrane protein YqjE|nr:hypothetical protein [Rhodospirillaceae bacterium]MBT7769780.1 hypothetical protein [Rhodospirillales bacterium]MBT4699683.1 hypothetical protein [Rhodospirillaceae bacterium]MBT5034438.1 hypothetical protein [Rhodospirillaceae bacterium]MBT6218404.1 hypothetical protein [Rhodospirillaceae bacterium]
MTEPWIIGFSIAAFVVVAAALLLIIIILQARRIAALAKTALSVVAEIEENTNSIWAINQTNKVAKDLLGGAGAIEENAGAIVSALNAADQKKAS